MLTGSRVFRVVEILFVQKHVTCLNETIPRLDMSVHCCQAPWGDSGNKYAFVGKLVIYVMATGDTKTEPHVRRGFHKVDLIPVRFTGPGHLPIKFRLNIRSGSGLVGSFCRNWEGHFGVGFSSEITSNDQSQGIPSLS
uniref:Discs large homolog 1-like protein n=1 Tax=Schistocephalus solidus TaxID=70667 RepID=A0A0X3P372_SCHSO